MGRFQPGNRAALKHGARSQRERERVRRELVTEMREVILEQLSQDRRVPGTLLVVDLAAVQAADVRQLHEYVHGQGGLISPRGQLRKCAEMMRAREHDLQGSLDRLGFGPRAAAQVIASLGTLNGKSLASQLAARRAAALEANQ